MPSDVRNDILSAINNLSGNPSLLDQAREQYPILKNHDIGYVQNLGRSGAYLESWPPGETGDAELPRPPELPLNQFGLENYKADTRPIDVLGDVVSHRLVDTDPTIKGAYENFSGSLEPWQKDNLQQQYRHAQKNEGETRPYDEWEKSSGMPAYFRGYPFQQWNNAQDMYTPDQMKGLDGMMNYLKGKSDAP